MSDPKSKSPKPPAAFADPGSATAAKSSAGKLPSIVIVGRPNVGKSTLFNRLTGTRRSIVTNEPGITRDRIYGSVNWEGKHFELVDTGGIVPEDKAGIPGEILRQANVAIKNATRVVQVVDGRVGPTPLDQELALLMRRAGKPPIIVVNKVDIPRQAELAAQSYELGDEIFPISAEHGYGIDVLLDALTDGMEKGEVETARPYVSLAIIGRPNVGKSTLLNHLVGAERSIVSDIPGTTRDMVDTVVTRGDKEYRFLDTAGIRRKGKTKLIAEKLSVIMARQHLERADIALLVADSAQGVTSHDATIASYAEQSGRSVIVVMNKFDLALQAADEKMAGASRRSAGAEAERREERPSASLRSRKRDRDRDLGRGRKGKKEAARDARVESSADHSAQFQAEPRTDVRGGDSGARANKLIQDYEPLVRARLKFLSYAPVVFLSAKTGERVERLYNMIDRVVAARHKRISTGELNRWLTKVDLARGTSPASREVKIFYITQATTAPPTFVLFTNQLAPLHFSYQRFLENELRKEFDFIGTPIRFTQRLKKRGSRQRERTDPRDTHNKFRR
jgi:ribosome-associated GTPase EngA